MNKFKIIIMIASALVFPARLFSQTNFFVSPRGNDSNPGTETKPFGSISRAMEEARSHSGKINLYLVGGIYRLDKHVSGDWN